MNTTHVLTSVAEHLGGFELNEPVQVTVQALRCGPSATVQLPGRSLPELAAELLAWADTLDNVTATVWRPHWPDDEQLHLEIRGDLTDNTTVKVFGGLFNGPDVPGLGYGRRIELSWSRLRSWAALLEGVAA
ncbi:hypothetical protein LWC34_53180 [Kibdelosporangium philippinense]|uniref:Polyketide cyclase / dehydrase and lipid transport n=1 Tax=Kibdelosporangium philippinense TaxID=211113 RepID=A0ABS8ZUZ2_9PSEU|nr:hypothetical protein [Kibdelosporangium philippinense]MCE7011513.1 hypothetical protein [Kibdelosporangium philippinense]